MKILVTGGAGFIGSNFIRYICDKRPDYKIVNLDKLTYAGNLDKLKDIENKESYKFIKGDICDRNAVENILKGGIEAIINFAAETHVDRSIIDADSFVKTNVFGTYVLLECARKYNVKFIQISTDEVYGSIERGSFKESDALQPSSPYSASKACADMLVHSYFVTYGLSVVITRSSNNFGPYQHPEKMIPLFITNAIQNKPLPVYGDGKNVRDWIYVLDNCRAIDVILRSGKNGEIYNVGTGNEMENLKVAEMILSKLKKPKNMIKFVEDRPGHDKRYSLNWAKIKKLGWRPQYHFADALKKTIKWYRKNEWRWKPMTSSPT